MIKKSYETIFHRAALCAVLTGAVFFFGAAGLCPGQARGHSDHSREVEFRQTSAIEDFVNKKMRFIEDYVERRQDLKVWLAEQNAANAKLSEKEILHREESWKKQEVLTGFQKTLLLNKGAGILFDLQEEEPVFTEIFLTDQRGLNVAMTAITSDYYQADEEWWRESYHHGKGRQYYGSLEYDESARSEVLPVFMPVYGEGRELLGVIKAEISLTKLKMEMMP